MQSTWSWHWTSPAALSSVEEMMHFSTGRTYALFPSHTHKPCFRHQWLPRTWSWDHFGLTHRGQCKLTRDSPSAAPWGDKAQILLTHLICSSSVRIFWHVPNAIPTYSATSLIVRRRSARMISRTRATVSSVWEVDGLPGWGSSSKEQHPLLKWEYHSNGLINLGRTLRKLLVAFRTFQHQFSPDRNRKWWTHAAELSPPSWDDTLQVDVHWEASTDQMWGDTGFRLCTYTCTELPPVLPCCHFAAYRSFPEKKICPGIKWSVLVQWELGPFAGSKAARAWQWPPTPI